MVEVLKVINFKPYIQCAELIEKLLNPFAEVVVHNLQTNKIEAIFNQFSRRSKGDFSELEKIDLASYHTYIGPYDKVNWDGRKLKSISLVIKDDSGKPYGFLCVNMDVTHFDKAQQLLHQFVTTTIDNPEHEKMVFQDDLYEKINSFIHDYCLKKHVQLEALTKSHKKELVRELEKNGAFQIKNAHLYIGRVLNMSRGSVYNYLKSEKNVA